jgi:hypothetical protein
LQAGLALQVVGSFEVAPDLSQLDLGALATAFVAAQPGGLFDQRAPFVRLGGQQGLDLSLADDRVHLAPQTELGGELDDIGQTAGRAVDRVGGLAAAHDPPSDADLRSRHRQRAVGVVEGELDLGGGRGAPAVAAGENDILHGRAAHGRGALFAQDPHDGVGDIALAAAVGPDDHRDTGFEEQLGLPRERLEALHAQRAQVHPRLHSTV